MAHEDELERLEENNRALASRVAALHVKLDRIKREIGETAKWLRETHADDSWQDEGAQLELKRLEGLISEETTP